MDFSVDDRPLLLRNSRAVATAVPTSPMGKLLFTLDRLPSINLNQDRISIGRMTDAERTELIKDQLNLVRAAPHRIIHQQNVLRSYFNGRTIPGTALPVVPTGTSMDDLLEPTEVSQGQVHLGNLRIAQKDYGRLVRILRSLDTKNPDGTKARLLAVRQANSKTKIVFHRYRVTGLFDFTSLVSWLPSGRRLLLDDSIAGKSWDDVTIPAEISAGHELDHASIDRFTARVLQGIPHPTKSNAEEQRVIDGFEASLRNWQDPNTPRPDANEIPVEKTRPFARIGLGIGGQHHVVTDYLPRFHAAHAYPANISEGPKAFGVDSVANPARFDETKPLRGRIVKSTLSRVTLEDDNAVRYTMSIPKLFFASSGVPGSAVLAKTSPLPPIDIIRDYIRTVARYQLGSWRGDLMTINVTGDGRLELSRTVRNPFE